MFGLYERNATAPPRFLAGEDPIETNVSWQMIKLRSLPKLSYTGYRLFSDAKGNKVEVTLDSGTPIRVYSGKVPMVNGDKITVLDSPNSKGESLVETLPDDKSRFWTFYPNTPENLTLMQSQAFKDTAVERGTHLIWLPIKMAGSSAPDLLDEAIKNKYDAIVLPEVPAPPTPSDKPLIPSPPDSSSDWQTIALAAAGGIVLALILANLGKGGKSR